ncbi:hypothetical protein SteCoe_24521 [Stentor coeruleus]|uniref:Uncharacterized protein n=1 Tax=Stentor coeruleus TaxID=5963 RepID=A0A1R2BHD3_9CILI|nr:hypothetical protein SteCoe_24521 [Stentor coeruleus]
MKKFEQENAVNMSQALSQDILLLSNNQHTLNLKLSKIKRSLEKCNNLLRKANNDISSINKAVQDALDGLKTANWTLTEDNFEDLKNIPQIVLEKFLMILNISKDQILDYTNFSLLKNRMNAFQPMDLQESELDDMFLVYNSKDTFKRNKVSEIVVDWMSYALEYRLLKDKLADTKRFLPYLNEKIQNKLGKMSTLSQQKDMIERNMQDIKKYLDLDKNTTMVSTEASEMMRKASSLSEKNLESKALLKNDDFSDLRINTDQLYNDDFNARKSIEVPILYENENELKCCRLKYFCF